MKERLMIRLDRMLDYVTTPHHQVGLRCTRTAIGFIMLYIYAINFAQRQFLFGPNGLYPVTTLFNLFSVQGTLAFDALYLAAMAGALLFALGVGGRVSTLINFLFFWSYTNAAFPVGDGGDNLLRIMLFYMLATDLYGALKPSAKTTTQRVLGMLHNFGLLAMALQIAALYLTSALMKIQGGMWQDGTALYYIMQVDEFRNPAVTNALLQRIPLLVLGCYATVLYQVAFPWLLLTKRAKWVAVAIGSIFHLGILFTMNLVSFSCIMISMELSMIPDENWAQVGAFAGRVRGLLAAKAKSVLPRRPDTRSDLS